MPLANFTDLIATVKDYANSTQATTNRITDFIRLTEARMVGDFAENQLLAKIIESETIVTDATSKALDAGYRGTTSIYLDSNVKKILTYLTPDAFFTRYLASTSGKPTAYTIQGMNIHFGPSPDDSYNAIHWFAKMPDLATDTTNSILTNHPNLYLYGVLSELFDFLSNDQKQGKYETRYLQTLDSLEEEARNYGSMQVFNPEASAGAPLRGYSY